MIGSFLVVAAATTLGSLENRSVWRDTNGVQINAHGGALMHEGDTWYWYGEHKTAGKAGNKAWVGVHAYSSTNLIDWIDRGIAFKVASPDEIAAFPALKDVEEGCILERPKVVRSQDGSRYVMFFHLERKGEGYRAAMTGIAESKTPLGPFSLVWTGRPNGGEMSRDMTLFTDPVSGIVYHVFASEDNSCLHVAELRPDGLGYTDQWRRITPGDFTEAPAIVKHGEWYYLIGSGCTGWRPNAARYYRAKSVWGPWERMTNPCRGGNRPEITWGGQSTGIFEVGGTAFAMFDVWKPDNAIDGRYLWLPIAFNDRGEMTIDYREHFTPSLPEPWEDEYVTEINRLPARTTMVPTEKSHVLKLDGTWDFTFVNPPSPGRMSAPEERLTGTIEVPSCWQLAAKNPDGTRMSVDPPLYVNITYPFAYDPPRVTTEPQDRRWTSWRYRIPRGIYSRHVTLPADWASRRVILRLNGYSSAVYVKVNGKTIGYGEDGRIANEWLISPNSNLQTFKPSNVPQPLDLELTVLKHCDGSYLEDQDFWRMSGLFRSVELVSEPKDGLFDFNVETRFGANGQGVVSVKGHRLDGSVPPYTWTITDGRGDELARGRQDESIVLPNVRRWSGNDPYLYRVCVTCAGETYERKVGFRTVSIEDGVLKLNGERLIVHGVDRHEMSPLGGYAMTHEEMERDIERLKSFNINAVRTSHYENDPYWYELCDATGIVLVAEANIECHGSGHPCKRTALSHLPSWRKAFVERNLNQVAVLRDHPSVIGWSMGNESGTGENMIAAYTAVKTADPTRFAQYEGIFNPYRELRFDRYGSDVICPMYETPAKIEVALQRDFKRPYILCEYSHAMGNSNGNLDEYWALADKYPRFQGGFIWDFADQGLFVDGALKYGGDFGDVPGERNGHCNGLFDAFRNPHPSAYEVRHFYSSF